MSVINFNPIPNNAGVQSNAGRGFDELGQADFIRLLTVQMKQQDPFEPVDNKEMLAQMAQFNSLASSTEMGATLKDISSKLDELIAAQEAAAPASPSAP